MTEYDSIVLPIEEANETFFSGANSGDGFRNLYSSIFDEAEVSALYIIKGGPGTGKSTFMKKFAKRSKENGAHVCAYFCGSDPNSLDAVVSSLGDKTVVVIDGTSPHAYDGRYPGAVSRILDFGEFWDREKLNRNRKEIINLAKKKSACYVRAYRYLRALSEIREDLREISRKATDTEKLKKACDRLARTFADGDNGAQKCTIRNRVFEGTTLRGVCAIDFASDSRLISVCDLEWTYPFFMEELSESLRRQNVSHTVLWDSLESSIIRGIYIDSASVRVLPFSKKTPDSFKNINMARFVSAEKLRGSRNKRSFGKKCAATVLEGAKEALFEAAEYHFGLENIYIDSMDFSALSAASEKWIDEMISCLL